MTLTHIDPVMGKHVFDHISLMAEQNVTKFYHDTAEVMGKEKLYNSFSLKCTPAQLRQPPFWKIVIRATKPHLSSYLSNDLLKCHQTLPSCSLGAITIIS